MIECRLSQDKTYKVYCYTNKINGKVYIGQTKQKLKERAGKNGQGYKGCTAFWNAIEKYGWNNFEVAILKENLTENEADYYEEYYINYYHSTEKDYGYNLQAGGSNHGITPEVSKKKSQSMIKKWKEEGYKEKMSKAHLGVSPYTNKRLPDKVLGAARQAHIKPVYCITTEQEFESLTQAAQWCNLQDTKSISDCCNGKQIHAGRHPETRERLRWKWANEEQKLNINDNSIKIYNLLTNEWKASAELKELYYKKYNEEITVQTIGHRLKFLVESGKIEKLIGINKKTYYRIKLEN